MADIGLLGNSATMHERQGHAFAAGGQNNSTAIVPATMGRESRAQEAIRMKDEQLKVLTNQNSQLLGSLDAMEEEANRIQTEKLSIDEENRKLKDNNFELRNKTRAAETAAKKAVAEMADKDSQLKIMTDQNSELLRLLEQEEAQTAQLQQTNDLLRDELETLKTKYANLLHTAKEHEQMAAKAAREGQLRAEELRILRAETEQLRSQNMDMKRKAQIELESLQEQLRVRKEKQYALLEQVQSASEEKRQALDQSQAMEEKLRKFHADHTQLQTQLQIEARSKRAQEASNKDLLIQQENLINTNKALQEKIQVTEEERLRMEAEAKDSGEQLREMAEKVFQLLERLKLAELGKTKAVESLRKKESEVTSLKKKNQRILRESTEEGKKRVKAELDKKVLMDQLSALKHHNQQLSTRCREEVKAKLSEHEQRKQAEEKIQTLGGRLNFLLNKLQADEEAKIVKDEDAKKVSAQLRALREKSVELTKKLNATGESNRIITQAMRMKQEELDQLQIRYDACVKQLQEIQDRPEYDVDGNGRNNPALEDDSSLLMTTDEVQASGGRGRFYLEHAPAQALVFIRGKNRAAEKLLQRLDINAYLKRAQKSIRFKDLAFDKIAHVLGLVLAGDEAAQQVQNDIDTQNETIDHLSRKVKYLADKLDEEEDAKRRTLLRYVAHVKQVASNEAVRNEGAAGSHGLHLAESGIGDEEMHALAALLRGNTHITELNLRKNNITNDGARALGAVLSGQCGLQTIDLRENQIGDIGIRNLAESLERSSRVRHVYVHAGGKIEALGTVVDERWARGRRHEQDTNNDSETPMMAVSTICAIDVRNNANQDDTKVLTNSSNNGRPVTGPSSNTALVVRRPSNPNLNNGPISAPVQIQRRKLSNAEKANRLKRQAEKKQRMRKEAGWAGSSGGRTSNGLPPISNRRSNNGHDQLELSREATTVDRNRSPGAQELSYVDKARLAAASALPSQQRKKKKKKKKVTAFEKRLQASPLMRLQAGKEKGKTRQVAGRS